MCYTRSSTVCRSFRKQKKKTTEKLQDCFTGLLIFDLVIELSIDLVIYLIIE